MRTHLRNTVGLHMPPDANPEPPSESTGTLRIALNHLPENVAAEVRISGPDEATVLVSESHEFTNLPAGTYTVEASPADTWFVTGDRSLSVEVTQGETATYCLRSVQNESPPDYSTRATGNSSRNTRLPMRTTRVTIMLTTSADPGANSAVMK